MNWIDPEHLLRPLTTARPVTLEPPWTTKGCEMPPWAWPRPCSSGACAVWRCIWKTPPTWPSRYWVPGAQASSPAARRPAAPDPAALERPVDLWLTDQPGDLDLASLHTSPLAPVDLDPDQCRIGLCTSGSSGEPKLIGKTLRQLANEVRALEQQWGTALGDAWIIGSVASQHIYGLLFRVLWPLCAGRGFLRRQVPFPEDLQRASLAQPAFAWVASPALLKRMGDNLTGRPWPRCAACSHRAANCPAMPRSAAAAPGAMAGGNPRQLRDRRHRLAPREQRWSPFAGVVLSLSAEGALCVSSPYLPEGHVEHTADAAHIEADGRVRLLGRLDRIVKLEEKRIALPRLEQALCTHAWVSEARLGMVEQGRAFLGVLLVLTPLGLHQLRNHGRRA